ncbi:MAG: hypothetical protein ACRD08_03385, partial [Acidimicrobiales bacterium]
MLANSTPKCVTKSETRHRLDTALAAGDPSWELTIAWQCYQQLRSIYHAPHPAEGRRRAERVSTTLHT